MNVLAEETLQNTKLTVALDDGKHNGEPHIDEGEVARWPGIVIKDGLFTWTGPRNGTWTLSNTQQRP